MAKGKKLMKISGFTFVRNGVKLDYPFIESIRSIMPIVNEFIVVVVESEDDTLERVKSIKSKKIKVIEEKWREDLRGGGRLLEYYTDIAKNACSGDWCFYLQADEVVHEKYLDYIKCALLMYKDDGKVDGFALKFKHFYGSYDLYHEGEGWVRNEVRIVRNDPKIKSFRAASGFRWEDGRKLNVINLDAYVYHYGWARKKSVMKKKILEHSSWHHKEEKVLKDIEEKELKKLYKHAHSLHLFTETHPMVMEERLKDREDYLNVDPKLLKIKTKYKVRDFFANISEFLFGRRIGEYENFKRIGYYMPYSKFTECKKEGL